MASGGRKVLVCVDGSDIAKYAFKWYVNNVWREGDDVLVTTKSEFNISFGVFGPSEKEIKEILEQSKKCQDEVEKLTADFADMMRSQKIKGSAVSVSGKESPGQILIDKADELKPNLIVIGTRGLSKFKGLLLGSVSDYVVKHAKCPVIVVRPEDYQESS